VLCLWSLLFLVWKPYRSGDRLCRVRDLSLGSAKAATPGPFVGVPISSARSIFSLLFHIALRFWPIRAGTRTKLARGKASNFPGPIYSFGRFLIADVAPLGQWTCICSRMIRFTAITFQTRPERDCDSDVAKESGGCAQSFTIEPHRRVEEWRAWKTPPVTIDPRVVPGEQRSEWLCDREFPGRRLNSKSGRVTRVFERRLQ
jgi:hypothetical protein